MKPLMASVLALMLIAYSGLAATLPAADMVLDTGEDRADVRTGGIAGGAPVPMTAANR